MKKKIGSIFIIAMIFIVIYAIFITKKEKETVQEVAIEPVKQPLEWHGNYIWDASTENNTWMCFRKKVNLKQKDIQNVIAQIAVDSKYWLYINDQMVVREGALKRGETKNSIYYDEVDLTRYLHEGENTIALLVWYWGDKSYSHNASGQGAMLFQAKIGNNYLVSNDTWKVSRHKAYLQDKLRPNKRLIEYNVYYDANLADENWYKSDYDDTNWENARILAPANAEIWGGMIERNIPQFKDYGIKEYENMAKYANYITTKTETLEMKIPYNAQFSPILKIEAPKGQKITIQTDQYADVNGDSVKCTYVTKEGTQEFESLAWMNGEKVYYEIPKGVKIIRLAYRETGYDTEMTGSFKCNDEFFNQLWQMADRTLYVNMRDSYMDCPNRERAQWWGDMSMEMLQAMYALDTKAYDLYEKGVKTTLGWKQDNHVLLTVVPNSDDLLHLPTQMLAGINSMYEYYEYTGKKEFLEEVYSSVKDYLNLWYVKEESGLVHSSVSYPIWEWGDSSGNVDYEALENAWYYLAMSKVAKMAEVLGYTEDKANFDTRLANLKTNFAKLWTPNGYKTLDSKFVDERVNALAVISGLVEEEKYEKIAYILTNSYESTVYMEKYILEALCQMGKIEEAQARIKKRYDEMVNSKKACSTLWENWVYEIGTKNHAWAGGPLIIMSKYFAGIEPLKKGYDVISIKPQFGNLNKIVSKVTTIKGDIHLQGKKSADENYLKVTLPTKARVAIEKMKENCKITVNGEILYENGKEKNHDKIKFDTQDEKYLYFYVESGEYEFRGK